MSISPLWTVFKVLSDLSTNNSSSDSLNPRPSSYAVGLELKESESTKGVMGAPIPVFTVHSAGSSARRRGRLRILGTVARRRNRLDVPCAPPSPRLLSEELVFVLNEQAALLLERAAC